MLSSTSLCGFCLVLLLAASSAKVPRPSKHDSPPTDHKGTPNPANRGLDLTHLPLNTAAYVGQTVVLTCWVNSTTFEPRIQWTEYAYSPNGGLISDEEFILPGHPQNARYSLNTADPLQYDLVIADVRLTDGGVYQCADANAPTSVRQRSAAQLIIISGQQNCTSTLPLTGNALEGQYYTTECVLDFGGHIVPYLRWSGPPPFGQAQTNTDSRCWSGLSFYAHRTMQQQDWESQANFTDNFLPVPIDTASNIPTFTQTYFTPRIDVRWPPQDMFAFPITPNFEYLVGQTIECSADAFPTASFQWHNLRTNERIDGSILTIRPQWLGFNQTLRCQATNLIDELPYSNDIAIEVHVVPPPTTPTTTPLPTTTTPPAVSNCFDLTGRWESVSPIEAAMCIEINATTGKIHGVLRNASDTFWVDLVGLTDGGSNDHTTFTGIWPENRAVSTMIGECSRCFGTEILLISAISRTKGGPPCATPGTIYYSQDYEFFRNPALNCPPITIPTFEG